MKALIIGGNRHGEWADVLDGSRGWVDIRSATTHIVRQITATVMRPTNEGMEPTDEAYQIHLAVHPDLVGPHEPQYVQALLQSLTMNEFARAHGTKLEVPDNVPGLIRPGGAS